MKMAKFSTQKKYKLKPVLITKLIEVLCNTKYYDSFRYTKANFVPQFFYI